MLRFISNKKKTTAALLLAIVLIGFNGTCLTSTENKDAQRAAVAASNIQTVVDKAVDVTLQLFHDGLLPKAKAHTVGLILQKTNAANQILINTARSMNVDSATNRCILADQLLLVANGVKELQEAGLLGIKSKTGELVFDTLLSSLIADIKIVAAVIGTCANSVTTVIAKLEVTQLEYLVKGNNY